MEATPEMEATTEEVTEETTSLSEENMLEHIKGKLDNLDEIKGLPKREVEEEVEEEEELSELLPEAEGEEPEVEEPEEELYEVVLPGGEKARVTYDELIRSYSQEADYTRKSERNAAALKETEEKAQSLDEARTAASAHIDEFILQKDASLKQAESVNWDQLLEDDPDHYHKLRRAVEATEKEHAKAVTAKAKLDEESAKEYQVKFNAHIQAQHTELIKRRPAFGNEETHNAEWDRVNKELLSRGYSAEELPHITDARAIDIVMDAIAWKDLQAKKPQAVKKSKKAPKFQKPGSPVNQTQASAAQKKADLAAVKRGDMTTVDYVRKYKIK